jgi:accessory gene regulator protein AgrB
MERLAKKIAASIGTSLGQNEENIAVVAYGLIGILQFLAIFILASVIGLIFSCWIEVVIVFLSVGFLRRFPGGAHSSGIYSCLVYSVFFVCSISAIARYALPLLPFEAVCVFCAAVFLFSYIMVALKAPVSPPNKPCRTEEKRKRLRKWAFIVVSAFMFCIAAALIFRNVNIRLYSSGLALTLSTLWQIIMMTKAGHKFISFFDGLFHSKKHE